MIRMVTVTDTEAPDITAPAAYATEATATLTPLDRTHYGIATSGDDTADITDDAPDVFPLGATTITWTATDPATNEMMATQVVTIVDTTKPDIAAPENITKEATAPTTPVTVGLATATDLVTDPVIITRSPEGNEFAVGIHTITWKADDGNGNTSTAAQTITITDTTKPVIALLGDNPQTVEFGSVYTDPGATAADAVDDNDELTTQIAADSTVDTGTVGDYTVTYTVSDKATNAATPVLRTVTVEDTAAPDIIAPNTYTTEATATLTPLDRTDYGIATSTDDTADITDDAPDAFPLGATTITWTATDPATNEMIATQVVTIVDTTKPVIALLGADPQTVEFGTTYTELNATATDEVDDDDELTRRIAINAGAVDVNRLGTYPVTYDVSDAEGNNADRVTRTVMVTDTAAPDITAPAAYTTEATATLTPLGRSDYGIATSTDDTADITDDAPPVFPLGPTTITWTATDKSTNEMMDTQVVTVVDTTKPDITAPGNITGEATGPTTPVTVGLATATDLVTDPVIITRTPEADAFAVGTHTITWKADDGNGNTSTAEQTITITDTTKPVIALLGADPQTVEFGSIYTDPGATATDAVDDNDELTTQIAADSTVDTGTVGDYTVTYTVSDKATNAATPVIRTVTVTDTEAPDIIPPNTYTTEATATLTPLGRAHYGIATSSDDTAKITDDALLAFPLGDTTITWKAIDTNGLFSTTAQTITITDTTAPDIAAPANITLEATGPTTPVTVGLATATDLVTDPVIITRTPGADAFAVGTHTITWKADDGNGNIITADQTITITDTTAPVIVLLGDNPQTVEFGSIYNDPGATATDAVDDNDELTTQIAAASTVDTGTVGDYTVTYTVSDTATNAATPVIRMVTVTDTVAPTIIAPANMTFEATDTLTPLDRSDYGTATSGDDTADITDDAPDAFPLGDTTITWTATDPATNEMIATQVVTVVDTTKPVIALNGLPEVRVEFGGSYTELQATATDAVDDDIQLTDKIVIAGTVDTNLAGIYHITYDVTDAAGNDAITVTRTVTLGAAQIVIDKVPPTIIAPSDVVVEATSPRTTVRVGQATATDNMDPMPAITRTPTGNEFVVGKHTITWTATDASDNSNSAEQTITITDTTKPSITLTDDTADSNTVEFGSTYNDPGATATDLVDNDVELTEKIVAASTVDTGTAGTYSITYTVSDTATNAATPVLRTVTVNPAPASTDANLSSLTLSAGTLSPTFAAGTISYAVNVANDVASTTVTPTTADAGATVTVAGETVTSGEASAAIDLTVGENAIAIVVTAEDGTAMKAYTVSVTRADNTAPSIQGRAAVDYAENGAGSVATYTATDVESNAITWSLGGTDADQLSIGATSGVLTFNAPPNFEDAQDTDTNNKYQVTVTATDNGEPNMSSTLNVTVTVTNVDEPGAIGAIIGTAQVGQTLTAGTVTDPDGGVTGTTWQWQSADDDSDIGGATESTYILAVADFGKPIQVVATYNDGHGDDKQVTSAPTDTVVAADAPDAPSIALAVDTGVDPSDGITSNGQVNVTGVVTDATWKYTINGTVTEVADSSVTFFTLDEGEYAATEVQVVQTLLGTDSAAANLGAVTVDNTMPAIALNGGDTTLTLGDTYTEQASVSDNLDASITLDISGETVDTQAAGTYTLTYDATDAAGNEAMQVERTVTVNPVPNTAPSIQGRAAVDYAENGAGSVATYTATDVESNAIAWTLTGTDARLLSIDANGVLAFRSAPDYETKSTYSVSVHATETDGDPNNLASELPVTVTVTNVDEDGAIDVIIGTAQVGQTLTAGTVTDPDGGVTGTTYKWQSADDDSDIGGATESTYTLAVADFGKPIQVIATYTDGEGNGKSVTSAPTEAVVAADAPDAPSIALAVDSGTNTKDGITNNGQVNVTGVVTDATWKYTINGGSTFTPAIGSSFTLTQGEYAATEVQVVQTLLGTDSAAATFGAVTVDKTPPVIDLNGAATITLTLGQNETNPPSATDNVDDNVTVTADIDIATVAAGTYTITYTAMDAAGNAADRVTRTVIVQPILAISAGPELTSSNAGNYAKHGDI